MNLLENFHLQHGQNLVALAGYQIPLNYRSAQEEFEAANHAAIIDRSFLGKVRVSGKDRESLLHRLSTNEMRGLRLGESRLNVFPNAKGRVVAVVDMLAFEDHYLMLTSPGGAEVLKAWIEKYTFVEDVRSANATDEWYLFAFLGRLCLESLAQALQLDMGNIDQGRFVKHTWENQTVVIHFPAALTPARIQLLCPPESAEKLWRHLQGFFPPIGQATYELLRILQGWPAVGHEIVEEYNPHEIGLFPFINFEKGCYIGQEVIARLDTYQKVQRQLVGIRVDSASDFAGAGVVIDGAEVGKVTSFAAMPDGLHGAGLAVVRKQHAQPEPMSISRQQTSPQAA